MGSGWQHLSTLLFTVLLLPGALRAGVNTWTSLGPDGGAAGSLVVDPHNPGTVYAATVAGLFKSADAGANWSVMTPLPAGSGAITSLVLDPQIRDTLYAATRQSDSGDPTLNAVFKSTDGGATWRALKSGLLFGLSAPLAIDPQNPNIVYSGSYNDLFKSTDGGLTWKSSGSGFPTTCCLIVRSLVIDPGSPSVVYAATGLGIFKSSNRGADWNAVFMYSASTPQFSSVALDASNPGTLYGLDRGHGIFKSTDGGAGWKPMNSGLTPSSPGIYFVDCLAMDPGNAATIYAGTSSGVFKTIDGGATWRAASSGLGTAPVSVLAVDPLNTGLLYASTLFYSNLPAIFKSTDGAASWSAIGKGLRAVQISGLTVDPQHSATLYASTSFFGRLKTIDGGATWQELPDGGSGPLAIDRQNTDTLYAARSGGVAKSQDGGVSWNSTSDGLPESCVYLSSLSIDPRDTDTVYAAFQSVADFCPQTHTGGLWRTTDGAASWTKLNSQPPGGGVHGVAVDPRNSSAVYAWNGMGVFKSLDGGASWDARNSGLPGKLYLYALAIDPQRESTLYAVLAGGGVFKSSDGGESWSAVNAGLPTISVNGRQSYLVTSLVIDPVYPDTLYANGNGVYRSTDGGATWKAVNMGLTTFGVNSLAIDSQDTRTVYAGTVGGVFAISFEDEL